MNDIFADDLHRKLDSIYPGASSRLDQIDELPASAGKIIVNTLLKQACESQHMGHILSARKALLTMPRVWLSGVLPDAIRDVVVLDDEWEYRRLIELLKDLNPPLFDSYINYGIATGDGEIYEAAADLKGRG
jgi:hypothetical protein